jgi:hypothetical protein
MMDTMNCVLFGMNAQVFVVVMHFEGNTTLVILHVELGVVPIMMVGQVNLAVINGHEPTIVVADDLDEVILKVLDDEEAMVAVVVVLSAQALVLSHDEAPKGSAEGHPHALSVGLIAAGRGVGVAAL